MINMINQTWDSDQTQICTARWPCISWRINRHDSTWPWNMVTLKRLWQLLRNWMIVAVGIVWVWKHWGKEISKLWRWSIRRRRTLTLCLSCTSSPEMSTSWRRCWRLQKCEVTSCQGSTMHWCWVKWKRGWRSWRRWDRRVFEKEHTRYWWNKFLNIWWKHMKVHMENASVSGAFSCPYCACSSVEGIHGEAWRATLQQRHFVADPTKDSAAGPSTAIISTRKWRFSKLALVSCLALYWDCVVVGFYMVLLDQGWFRSVGHKNKHLKTVRINKDQKSKSPKVTGWCRPKRSSRRAALSQQHRHRCLVLKPSWMLRRKRPKTLREQLAGLMRTGNKKAQGVGWSSNVIRRVMIIWKVQWIRYEDIVCGCLVTLH